MSQRPLLASLLMVGMAATALHVGRPSGLATSEAVTSSSAPEPVSSESPQAAATVSWAKELDADPGQAGRLAAQRSLGEKLCAFMGLPAATCTASSTAPAPDPAAVAALGAKAPQVMIAFAPDPVHTHLALIFDRMIDAYEDALQDSGWQYQGYWLPWSVSAGTKSDTDGLKSRQQQRLYEQGREKYPGVLVFRPALENRPSIVLFLVTDSPTSGINRAQFQEALREFSAFAANKDHLSIAGPTFTGSANSLREMLEEAKSKGAPLETTKVTLASGTVSDWECSDFLPAGKTLKGANPVCTDSKDAADTFVSFGSPVNVEMEQVIAFLLANGHLQPNEIAQLSEDESGFGNLSQNETNIGSQPLKLGFPRGISHLRTAYQKNGVWGFGSTNAPASVSLTLDFDEQHEAEDSVPSYARQQLPVSQEGSMGQIAAILEQRHIKAVLLSATDVLDELFVAQMLAREAPNVMVIVRGTDVLFLRSGDGGVYHNMFAVSPWPLIQRDREWSKLANDFAANGKRMRAFSNGDSEGVYNATTYLLDQQYHGGPRDPQAVQLLDYSSPIHRTARPPIWFSAIGHGAYWPLAVLENTGDKAPINLPAIPFDATDTRGLQGIAPDLVPRSLRFAIALALILAFLHAGKCLELPLMAAIAGTRYSLADKSTRAAKLWLQLALCALGVLMLCLLAVPRGIPLVPDYRTTTAIAFGVIALSLGSAKLWWRLRLERQTKLQPEATIPPPPTIAQLIPYSLAFFLAACLLWILVWLWIPYSSQTFDGRPQFLLYRASYPFSGDSPTLPLLLALGGIALALFNYLGRLTFGTSLAPRLPANVECVPNCPSEESVSPVTKLLQWPKHSKAHHANLLVTALIVGPILALGFTMQLRPRTLEGSHITTAITLLVFIVLTLMLRDLLMAFILWSRLKKYCLDPLEACPLRRGFSAISGLTWKDLWLIPQSGLTQYRALMRALEQSERTVMNDVATQPVDGSSLRSTTNEMWSKIQEKTPNPAEVVEKFKHVQAQLSLAADSVLKQLCSSWKEEVGRITASDSLQEKDTEVKLDADEKRPVADRIRELREEWLALIYIHYIRLVLVQVRNRLATAAMLYLLLVWTITSYPYINRHTLMVGLTALLGGLSFVIIATYASINRDAILSRTTEQTPGKLDFDFYAKVASMVGIPLVGLIASQFPEVTSFLFSWIEPGMSAVK